MAGGGRNPGSITQLVTACLVSLLIRTSATSHIVGGDEGWTIPTSDPHIYSTWAHGKTFNVGDILVFTYRIGHTVAEVSKAEYDHCAATHPISTAADGPVSITINSPGDHYFICTFPGHCGYGQKLAITAIGAAANANTNATTPHPHPAAPLSSPAASPPAATPSPTTLSAGDVTAAASPPPSPPKSAGVGLNSGLLLPFLFAVADFLLSAQYL